MILVCQRGPLVLAYVYNRTLVFNPSTALIAAMGRGENTRLDTANHARSVESTLAL